MSACSQRLGRRLLVITLFLALAAPTANASGWRNITSACVRALHLLFPSDRFIEDRIREFWLPIVESQREEWSRRSWSPPEGVLGLTTADALAWLQRVARQGLSGHPSISAGSSAKIVNVDGRRLVLRRTNTQTQVIGDGRVVSTTTNGRYDALAFLLDRYLGTNLVPPTIAIDAHTSVQLHVPSRGDATLSAFEPYGKYIPDASHIRLLDYLMSNGDRDQAPNTLNVGGRLVAIDFDRSHLSTDPSFYRGSSPGYLLGSVTLEPRQWVGATGVAPGVFSRRVVERLRMLDGDTLRRLTQDNGMSISNNEIANIIESRDGFLRSLNRWVNEFGEANILIDP